MAHHASAPSRSRLINLFLAGAVGLSAASAQAGALSVVTEQANGIVTFSIFDSNPLDMCDGAFCFADFGIDFNPAELAFLPDASNLPEFAMANANPGGPMGAKVWVSFLSDETTLGAGNLLFSLGFKALVTKEVELTVGPLYPAGQVAYPYTHTPVEVSAPVSAVPEPSSVLMAAIGLAGLVWSRRRHSGKQHAA